MARGFEREDAENTRRGFSKWMCEGNPCIEPATQKIGSRHYCDDHARVAEMPSA